MELKVNVSLTGRDRAILRAVASGNAELAWGVEPDLFIDGRCCCDQSAAHKLARAGFIAPATVCVAGQRVVALVTDAGLQELSAPVLVAA